jgi:hypothetical protein
VLVKTNHEQTHEPKVAAARVASNGEILSGRDVFFKGRDGRWLPIDTPTSKIPAQPSAQARLDALLLQACAIHSELAALLPAIRGHAG